MEIRAMNPISTQKEIAKELGCSSSSLQRYKHNIKMLSPFRIPANSHKRKQKISNCEHDLQRPQLTSNDLRRPQVTSKESSSSIEMVNPNTSKKTNLKGGGNI